MDKLRYMISDAANLVHVESHVLRYWEEELELDIPRNEMGHRYYTEENIQMFERIKKWKEAGYQLKAIKMLVKNGQAYGWTDEQPVVDILEQPQKREHHPAAVEEMTEIHMAQTDSSAGEVWIEKGEGLSKMEQFRILLSGIVKDAMEENNHALSLEIGTQVQERVLKELNYLAREQEERAEERCRKLDEAIRTHQKAGFRKKEKPVRAEKKKPHRFKRGKKTDVSLGGQADATV